MIRNRSLFAISALLAIACGQSRIRDFGSLERAPADATVQQQVAFYVARLHDKDYFEHYSTHEEIPSEWYVAAEELGAIGLPAIPALIDRLDMPTDVFERQQIFYALALAVQDPNAVAIVGTDAPYHGEAFPAPEHHAELTTKWMEWWDLHRTAVLTGLDETMTKCVHGFVRSAADNKPLQYANVVLRGTRHGVLSGRDGFFVIDGVPPGVYELRVMMMAYKEVTVDSVVVDADVGCGKLIEVELEERGPETSVPKG
jgi:hypothetical protein